MCQKADFILLNSNFNRGVLSHVLLAGGDMNEHRALT